MRNNVLSKHLSAQNKYVVLGFVVLLGIIAISILMFTNKVHERYHEIFLQDDMVHEIQINIFHSHLVMEEMAHGDLKFKIDTVWMAQEI